MKDLIEALTILLKYMIDPTHRWPTACEHDILYVCGIDLSKIPVEDVRKLSKLGFLPGSDDSDYDLVEEILGHDFAIAGDFSEITNEQWDMIKNELSNSFYSFRFGSC